MKKDYYVITGIDYKKIEFVNRHNKFYEEEVAEDIEILNRLIGTYFSVHRDSRYSNVVSMTFMSKLELETVASFAILDKMDFLEKTIYCTLVFLYQAYDNVVTLLKGKLL